MAERELALVGEAALPAASIEHLLLGRAGSATSPAGRRRHGVAQEGDHAALPAHLAEHAGGAQHAAASSGSWPSRVSTMASTVSGSASPCALGGRADQLLEVERVAVRPG